MATHFQAESTPGETSTSVVVWLLNLLLYTNLASAAEAETDLWHPCLASNWQRVEDLFSVRKHFIGKS